VSAGAESPADALTPEHDDIHLDWLTASHHDLEQLRQLTRGELRESRPFWPYKWAEEDEDGVRIMGGGPLPRPYLLEIRGEAFRRRRAAGKDDIGTVAMAAFNGLHCTRLDVARDVTNELTPAWLRDAWDAGRYVSLWRRRKWTDEGHTGHMLRLGGADSLFALRVYDKRAEMLERRESCPFSRLTRWELVLRGERAARALDQLSRVIVGADPETGEDLWPVHPLWCAWLSNSLTVTREPVDRRNKHQERAKAAPDSAWEKFVSVRDGSTLRPEAREVCVTDRAANFANWFASSCAPSLHVMAKLVGWKTIFRLAKAAGRRVGPTQRALLSELSEATRAAKDVIAERIGPRPKPRRQPIDPNLLRPSGALAYLSLQKGYPAPARVTSRTSSRR
jgi:hypothetical protein